MEKIEVQRLSENARLPSKSSTESAGHDLYSAENVVIKGNPGRALVKTDLMIRVPEGCYGRIAPRSDLALKNGINVMADVVDRDYRENVGVVLLNFGEHDFVVKAGDRIAQIICEKVVYAKVQETEQLASTKRGTSGFGSTGVSENDDKKKQTIENNENEDDLMDILISDVVLDSL